MQCLWEWFNLYPPSSLFASVPVFQRWNPYKFAVFLIFLSNSYSNCATYVMFYEFLHRLNHWLKQRVIAIKRIFANDTASVWSVHQPFAYGSVCPSSRARGRKERYVKYLKIPIL